MEPTPRFPVDPASTDGYVECEEGHYHWGRAGAAGLFLLADLDGTPVVLLQHRAPETHEGDCWGVPGGALDWEETPLEGALREAEEEMAGFTPGDLTVLGELVVDHGGWSYTTVVARGGFFLPTADTWETGERGLAWVTLSSLGGLDLHSGLEAALPELLSLSGALL